MRSCPDCGWSIDSKWELCPNCGKVLPAAMAVTHRRDPGDHHTPHRGGVVMALGIIGLVIFLFELVGYALVGPFAAPLSLVGLVLSIVAWVKGGSDLRQMSAGTMDPSGHGMTMGGLVCGIIGTTLRIVEISCVGVVLISFLAAGWLSGIGHAGGL